MTRVYLGGGSLIENVNVVDAAGSAYTLPDVSVATMHHLTLTEAACVLTLPPPVRGKSFTLSANQDTIGGRLLVWPGNVQWPAGGGAPILSTLPGAKDLIAFLCDDDVHWCGVPRVAFSAPPNYRNAVLADNPVSYWRLGEAAGTVAADLLGRNPGTYTGGFVLAQPGATSDGNTAVKLDGATGYISVPDAADLRITGDITIEAWIHVPDNAAYYMIMAKGATGDPYELRIEQSTSKIGFQVAGGVHTSVAALPLGQWVHVALTRSGTAMKFFINGILDSTQTVPTVGTDAGDPLLIGKRSDGNFFKDLLDEVAIYDHAVSDARLATHYASA